MSIPMLKFARCGHKLADIWFFIPTPTPVRLPRRVISPAIHERISPTRTCPPTTPATRVLPTFSSSPFASFFAPDLICPPLAVALTQRSMTYRAVHVFETISCSSWKMSHFDPAKKRARLRLLRISDEIASGAFGRMFMSTSKALTIARVYQ